MDEELCLLPAGETGRVLDRLLLLEQIIGPQQVRQALEDTGCFDSRRCRLTREVIFWVVLAMGILADLPIRQVLVARAGLDRARVNLDFTRVAPYGSTGGEAVGENLQAL